MGAAAASLSYELRTPGDFYRAIATDQKHDHLMWLKDRKGESGREWFKLNSDFGAEELSRYTDQPDVFITPNEFYGWRLVRLLSALNAFYVDIDVHTGDHDPMAMVAHAISRIERAQVPMPNMVVYTGRGVHLYWLFNRTPAQALPRWQLVQKTLVTLCQGDRQAIDSTRVLRVVGTTNPKATVGRKTVRGEVLHHQRYDFDWLCDQIVQIPRAELRDIRAARARKQVHSETAKGKDQLGSIYKVWYLRYQDMIRICEAHWFGGVPPGKRDFVLFQMANALSWFTRSEALVDEIKCVVHHNIPSLTDKEAQSYTTSIVNRAKASAEGKKYMWNGNLVDPRYRFTSERLWEDWADLVEGQPGLIDKLRAIVPKEVREERKRTRQAERDRVEDGRYQTKRSDYLAKCEQQRQQALGLRLQGKSWAEVGAALGCSGDAARRRFERQLHAKSQAAQAGCPTPDKSAHLVIGQGANDTPQADQQSLWTVANGTDGYVFSDRTMTCPTPDSSAHLVIGQGVQESRKEALQREKETKMALIQTLKTQGLTVREIAEKTGIAKSTVQRLLTACPTVDRCAPLA